MDESSWQARCEPPGLVLPVRMDRTGAAGPTPAQARGARWRQTSQGFHVPATTDTALVDQRIAEAAIREGLPVVTGWAACRLHLAGFFDGRGPDGTTPLPVPVIQPRWTRAPQGLELVRSTLPPPEITNRFGIRVTCPERAVVDEIIRLRDLREGVVVIDMACAGEITSLARLRAYLARCHPRRHLGLVHECLEFAVETRRSPAETRMRLIWVLDLKLPTPHCNQPVWSLDGRLLAVPDQFEGESGVAGEHDGALHRSRARHRRDNDRLAAMAEHRIERFTVVAGDSDQVVREQMLAARQRAAWLPKTERSWTLDPPPGAWIPPESRKTLDQRIQQREGRERRTR